MIRHFARTLWICAVASSLWVIWKPPSPTTAQTFLRGFANAAPIAAGQPKPIVPAPPLEIQWRFVLARQNCAAHIWCWPTSVVTIASPWVIAFEPVEHVLRAQAALLRVLERVLLAPALALREPRLGLRHLDQRDQVLDHEPRVAEDRDVGLHDLVELGRIDVDVDLHRAGAELVELAGDAVVPARADPMIRSQSATALFA
jgi:hypothetical protein